MNAKDLRNIAAELRVVTDRELDDAEIRKGLREAATAKGIDWSQLKALVKAQAQDARDDGDRVGRLVERADFALAYAEMLKMNEKDETRSSSEPEAQTMAEASVRFHSPAAAETAYVATANLEMPDPPPFLDRRQPASA